MIQGTCSDEYSGFDGCPVLLATDVMQYCRTELDLMVKSILLLVHYLLLLLYREPNWRK